MNRLSHLLQSLPPPARNGVIIGGALILSAVFLMLFGWLLYELGAMFINLAFSLGLRGLGNLLVDILNTDAVAILTWLVLTFAFLRFAKRRGFIMGMDSLLWRPGLPAWGGASPAPMQAFGTIPIALLDNDGKLAFKTAFGDLGGANILPLREIPKGAKLVAVEDRASVTVELPSAIQYWWTLPYGAAPALFFIAYLPLGGILGGMLAVQSSALLGFVWAGLGVVLAVFAGVMTFFILRRLTHPKIRIHVTQEAVHLGKLMIPRDANFGGIWAGGEQTAQRESDGKSMHPVTSFKREGMMWTELRVSYGRWGETLPYMMPKDEAYDYVLWLAEILEWVSKPDARENIPEAGIRAQAF
jgi:hypothetical protein